MKKNVGGIDQWLRIVVGSFLLSIVFIGPQTPLGWFGLVPLLTGFLGFCPLYPLLGLNTCPSKD
ncbi:YgaP family membrane protein [Magnetococcales bacterium HHB-1]